MLGGFWSTWMLAVTVAAAGPLSYAPVLGDYTRRISRSLPRPPRAARRGRRDLSSACSSPRCSARSPRSRSRPRRLLRRRPRGRRARLVRAADPRDRARGRRRAGRAQPLRQRPRPGVARPAAEARPHHADHVGRRRRPALRRHLRARRGELDHRDDARAQRPRRAVGRRQPRRLPRRPPRALRPASTSRPSTRAATAAATGSPAAGTCARVGRVGGRLGLRAAGRPDRALHRPAREPRRRRRPQPPRLRRWSPAPSTSQHSPSGPSTSKKEISHDRSTHPLGRLRREAGLRRPADRSPACPTPRTPPSSRASTWRSSARRWTS